MSASRTTEDLLREEYIRLRPSLELAFWHVQTELTSFLLPFRKSLAPYEKLELRSRIKECESAIDTLRRKQEASLFDERRKDPYTLTVLKDLVGFRVMAFPKRLLHRINDTYYQGHKDWTMDHSYLETKKLLFMFKYHNKLPPEDPVSIEVQFMPLITGLFSDIEHDAVYKPREGYKGIQKSFTMRNLREDVLVALDKFDDGFESTIVQMADEDLNDSS